MNKNNYYSNKQMKIKIIQIWKMIMKINLKKMKILNINKIDNF